MYCTIVTWSLPLHLGTALETICNPWPLIKNQRAGLGGPAQRRAGAAGYDLLTFGKESARGSAHPPPWQPCRSPIFAVSRAHSQEAAPTGKIDRRDVTAHQWQ